MPMSRQEAVDGLKLLLAAAKCPDDLIEGTGELTYLKKDAVLGMLRAGYLLLVSRGTISRVVELLEENPDGVFDHGPTARSD